MDINEIRFQLQEEVLDVVRIVREKGGKHFQTGFLLSGGLLFVAYFFLYKGTGARLESLNGDILNEKTRAEHSESYKLQRDILLTHYGKLPKPAQKDGWLFDKVLDSASKQGIVLDAIGSQRETGPKQFSVLTIPVTAKVTYAQVGKWIESLENEKPVIFVSGVTIRRGDRWEAGFGVLEVELEISTIIPNKYLKL